MDEFIKLLNPAYEPIQYVNASKHGVMTAICTFDIRKSSNMSTGYQKSPLKCGD